MALSKQIYRLCGLHGSLTASIGCWEPWPLSPPTVLSSRAEMANDIKAVLRLHCEHLALLLVVLTCDLIWVSSLYWRLGC